MSFLGEVKATIVSRNIDCHRVKQCPRSFFCVMRESCTSTCCGKLNALTAAEGLGIFPVIDINLSFFDMTNMLSFQITRVAVLTSGQGCESRCFLCGRSARASKAPLLLRKKSSEVSKLSLRHKLRDFAQHPAQIFMIRGGSIY